MCFNMVPMTGLEPAEPGLSNQYLYQFGYKGVIGLRDRDWTCGLMFPEHALYQTELHRDTIWRDIFDCS